MAEQPAPLTNLRARVAMAGRRFNAWWEGYAFDEALERADLADRFGDVGARGAACVNIRELLWGAGRVEPGDPAWTMRHARALGLPLKATVLVFGAGLGAPLRDLKSGTRWKTAGFTQTPAKAAGLDLRGYDDALERLHRAEGDGAITLFELSRDSDPAAFCRLTAEMLRPGAPAAFVDYAIARRGVRLRSCFSSLSPGTPRTSDEYAAALKSAGFSVSDVADESRSLTPLIAAGRTGVALTRRRKNCRTHARALIHCSK